jgi:drug/metabolite transporter (DMT)-like permease
MLNGAVPLFAALVGALRERRLPSLATARGLLLGLLGAVLVAWPALHAGAAEVMGIVCILAALVCYGIAVHLARPLQQRHGALPVIARALAVAAVLTAPRGVAQLAVAHWTAPALLSLLALGALGTGVAFALLATAVGRLGATRASATAFLIPGVALLLGVLVRHERVDAVAVAGAALSLLGVWMLRRADH